ncbi:D-alanyl-D-alanine carboxypeptidase [Metabacillus idriensis]|uniref:D-alanyl-D-alanine carboxypeptidase family protein n=1 Tax=Metabacillus idriensis TaxID=324768 RepID=UPI0008A93CCF|nr:D-alanyl-D-alanine carboxypeptidase family protein [Metabacillus idriensis]MCM3597925.1 D-alanyl-D-alanine carboxypeptidase [Metabacillus idriensis]OHR73598.1 hypothetical protein HMPREF3291_18825 [Bacillus sp. HMSC76G11]
MKFLLLFTVSILTFSFFQIDQVLASSHDRSPVIQSESAILIDAKTGEILFEKNSEKQMYPASLTKVATAIYAIEKGNLEDIVTVSKNAVEAEGTRVYLEEGEQVPLKKLVQGLLINSGNDAGVAIAEHLDGSVSVFSENINEYLKETIGVTNTNFENPHGLFNQNHLTTAQDFAKITQYAIQNKTFKEIFGTKELKWKGQTWDTTLFNHHKLMREMPYEGVDGGKTGYVDQSGHTLVTTAKRGKLNLIAVIFKGSSQTVAYSDTVNLLNYGFENYQTSTIAKGKKYEIDDKEFVAPKNLYYSHPIGSELKEVIKKNGTLEIINQDQELISEFNLELTKKTVKSVEYNAEEASTKSNPFDLENHISIIIFLSMGLSAGIVGFFYNQVRGI